MKVFALILTLIPFLAFADDLKPGNGYSGNPVINGCYADPQIRIYNGQYWIFPTGNPFANCQSFDCFSSKDMVTWTRHKRILTDQSVKWVHKSLWAPDSLEKDGKYYLFFSGNDAYPIDRKNGNFTPCKPSEKKYGGIGVAVASSPEGPYRDLIGKPLIDQFWNAAQPIDQYVFKYKGEYYMIYGGWGKCNLVKLADDFKSLVPLPDGSMYKDMTPEGYVEGSVMFERKGKWYFMWSEGNWTNSSYKVAYGMADTPFGPFKRIATILSEKKDMATGAGHHSVMNYPNTDDWYICYHRRPIPNYHMSHRETCIDRLYFDKDGKILPVKMTFRGVKARPLPQ